MNHHKVHNFCQSSKLFYYCCCLLLLIFVALVYNSLIFTKKMLSVHFLTPAETKILELLSPSVERFGVSRMRDFYGLLLPFLEPLCQFLHRKTTIDNSTFIKGIPSIQVVSHCGVQHTIFSLLTTNTSTYTF